MGQADETTELEIARLFPLPEVVLFPNAWLPLHIFEPRYLVMTEDALGTDRQIALVLPTGADDAGPPPLNRTGCLGTISDEQTLPDGRYLFLLRGESRVQIIEEIPSDKPYRSAYVRRLESTASPSMSSRRLLQRTEILQSIKSLIANDNESGERLVEFLSQGCRSGVFSDVVSFAMPLTTRQKQSLLAELDVDRRLEALNEYLSKQAKGNASASPPTFPPPIDLN